MGYKKRLPVAVLAAVLSAAPASAQETVEDPAVKAQKDAFALRQLEAAVLKAEAEARTAAAAAEKAEREGSASGVKAVADALPNPASGGLDVKANAGQLEATVLATVASNQIAPIISRDIRAAVDASHQGATSSSSETGNSRTAADAQQEATRSPAQSCKVISVPAAPALESKPTVVILSGTETVGFSHWDSFVVRACQVEYLLNRANNAVDARNEREGGPVSTSVNLTAGAAVSAATKLLAIMSPSWETGGVSVTQEDAILVTAVARAYLKTPGYPMIWPGRVAKLNAGREVVQTMVLLGQAADEARSSLERLAKARAVIEDKASTAAQKASAQKVISIVGPAETDLSIAIARFDALASALRGTEEKSALPLNLVIQEKALAEALGPNGVAVWLRTHSASGGYYTKKRIWHLFGGMPFHVTGGVVVSYTAVRPGDWQVVSAGSYACHAGYMKLNEVSEGLSALKVACTGD